MQTIKIANKILSNAQYGETAVQNDVFGRKHERRANPINKILHQNFDSVIFSVQTKLLVTNKKNGANQVKNQNKYQTPQHSSTEICYTGINQTQFFMDTITLSLRKVTTVIYLCVYPLKNKFHPKIKSEYNKIINAELTPMIQLF